MSQTSRIIRVPPGEPDGTALDKAMAEVMLPRTKLFRIATNLGGRQSKNATPFGLSGQSNTYNISLDTPQLRTIWELQAVTIEAELDLFLILFEGHLESAEKTLAKAQETYTTKTTVQVYYELLISNTPAFMSMSEYTLANFEGKQGEYFYSVLKLQKKIYILEPFFPQIAQRAEQITLSIWITSPVGELTKVTQPKQTVYGQFIIPMTATLVMDQKFLGKGHAN